MEKKLPPRCVPITVVLKKKQQKTTKTKRSWTALILQEDRMCIA